MPEDERLLIPVKEAADRLSLTPWSVYKLLDDGAIAGKYQGRRRYVVVESMRAYVDNLPTEPVAS